MAKGSDYERKLCKRFGLWWTNGQRDDVFWRSSNSGGRATMRARAGHQTHGQHGDMAATDPVGVPFVAVFTVEMKRGYSKFTVQDMLDKADGAAVQEFEKFFAQVLESYEAAGSLSWMLVTRRDRRTALLWLPVSTVRLMRDRGAWLKRPLPYAEAVLTVRDRPAGAQQRVHVACMHLDQLWGVEPDIVRGMAAM